MLLVINTMAPDTKVKSSMKLANCSIARSGAPTFYSV